MRYRVRHTTAYRYEESVALSHNAARLVPRADGRQRLFSSVTTITPRPAVVNRVNDYYGNVVETFAIEIAHASLEVTTESDVEVLARPAFDASLTPPWESLVAVDADLPFDVAEHRFESPLVPRTSSLRALAEPHFPPGRPVLEGGLALCHAIFTTFAYDPDATTVSTQVLEVLERRRGVCQDFSQVMIGALRSLGLPARYVSGYLETRPPPGTPRLVGADASHAWVQLYCGVELGFVDLDPTNDVVPGERHVTVAYGRDFSDVSPVKGLILGGGKTTVDVAVDVEPLSA